MGMSHASVSALIASGNNGGNEFSFCPRELRVLEHHDAIEREACIQLRWSQTHEPNDVPDFPRASHCLVIEIPEGARRIFWGNRLDPRHRRMIANR
jgi:hypothetical protein